MSAGNHSLRILQHCTDKRAAGNLLLLSLLNNPANSINLKFSRNKKPWSNGVVQRISQKAGALNCSACCALADSGHVTASSLPVTPIHALRVSWPTNLFWDCPRQSSLKARSCIAMQNSSSSTPCPSQQSPVRGCSVNCTFMAGVWSLIQPWIPVFRSSGRCKSEKTLMAASPWHEEAGGDCKEKAMWRRESCSMTLVANGQVLC